MTSPDSTNATVLLSRPTGVPLSRRSDDSAGRFHPARARGEIPGDRRFGTALLRRSASRGTAPDRHHERPPEPARTTTSPSCSRSAPIPSAMFRYCPPAPDPPPAPRGCLPDPRPIPCREVSDHVAGSDQSSRGCGRRGPRLTPPGYAATARNRRVQLPDRQRRPACAWRIHTERRGQTMGNDQALDSVVGGATEMAPRTRRQFDQRVRHLQITQHPPRGQNRDARRHISNGFRIHTPQPRKQLGIDSARPANARTHFRR